MPLYHRIFLTLRDEILNGQHRAGSLLPTEKQLCEAQGVSRITARRALAELASSGLVERRRRLGTRVIFAGAAGAIEANLEHAVESLVAFGRNTEVEVVEIVREPADPLVAEKLGLAYQDAIVRAVRIRLLEGEPLGVVVSYAPIALAKIMTPKTLVSTPMLELLRGMGRRIGGARQKIVAALASPDLAARLGIEPRSAVLRIERLVSDADGRPLLLTVAEYRADRYHLVLDMVSRLDAP